MIAKLKAKLPDWLWAGLVTAWFTFVALFAASLLGWVTDVVDWASTEGANVFPSVSVLGKAFVAAAGAALAGLINAVYRFAQTKTALVPGSGPTYGVPPAP